MSYYFVIIIIIIIIIINIIIIKSFIELLRTFLCSTGNYVRDVHTC